MDHFFIKTHHFIRAAVLLLLGRIAYPFANFSIINYGFFIFDKHSHFLGLYFIKQLFIYLNLKSRQLFIQSWIFTKDFLKVDDEKGGILQPIFEYEVVYVFEKLRMVDHFSILIIVNKIPIVFHQLLIFLNALYTDLFQYPMLLY